MEDAGAERQPLLGGDQTRRQYESLEQVKYQEEHFKIIKSPSLSSSTDQVAVRLDSSSDSADRSWSTSHPGEGEASDSQGEQAKTINIDESAPNSYVCLGYIFSIIAGLCFTSWQEEPINY